MRATIIKSLVFTVVTVLATTVLAATIRNSAGGAARDFHAVFSDATSLNKGDDIRMSGVKIGTVSDIGITDDNLATVAFSVSTSVTMTRGTTAQLKFRNLIGQRYIALEPPATKGVSLPVGYTFALSETQPALDLTMLFNGFQPLLRLLSPDDVNNLSAQIVAVFQGEDVTVDGLLASTASLTSTLADKDEVIGELITSLSQVLTTVNDRSGQLDTTLITLQRLVSGLAEDRKTIGDTVDGLGHLTSSVADLLDETRAPLKGSIDSLGTLSKNLSDAESLLDDFLQTLPIKLDRIGRIGSYGSWLNFYECSIQGVIPRPEGYRGDLGALPVAARCQS